MSRTISFDFDDTLMLPGGAPNARMVSILLWHSQMRDRCIIVTSRTEDHDSEEWIEANDRTRVAVPDFVKKHSLPVSSIHYTEHEPKGPLLYRLGADWHYDDDRAEIESAIDCGVIGILVSLEEPWKE